MILVERVDRHLVEVEVEVRALARHKRLRGGYHAIDLLRVVHDDDVVEPVALLRAEIELHLREVVDDVPWLEEVDAGANGNFRLEAPADQVPARHDFVVDVEPERHAKKRKRDGPLHDRQQVHAASAHRSDLAVGAHAREDENARNEKRERHRPLHCLGEAHERKLADERGRDAVEDEADDLDHQADRYDERQNEKREQEAREEGSERVFLYRLHENFSTK